MKKLNVNEGKIVGYMPLTEGGKTICNDALETYNKCGKLPSELMEDNVWLETANANLDWIVTVLREQNRELIEALKKSTEILEDRGFQEQAGRNNELLTKIENNQRPQP